MTREQIFAHLAQVLQQTFDIDPARITPAARLYDDLDIDSIDAVDLMVKLRSLTERRLQPEAFRSVRTIGDVVEALYAHLSEKA